MYTSSLSFVEVGDCISTSVGVKPVEIFKETSHEQKRICGNKTRYFKLKHDLFLTKWIFFLNLKKQPWHTMKLHIEPTEICICNISMICRNIHSQRQLCHVAPPRFHRSREALLCFLVAIIGEGEMRGLQLVAVCHNITKQHQILHTEPANVNA